MARGLGDGVLPGKGLKGVPASPKAAGTADSRFTKVKIYKYMYVLLCIENRLQ